MLRQAVTNANGWIWIHMFASAEEHVSIPIAIAIAIAFASPACALMTSILQNIFLDYC